jgi:hypothetical protein
MDRTTWLLILQGLGVTLQLINAQIAVLTHSATVALIVSAVLAGYQFVLQHLGNQTPPVAKGGGDGKTA